MKTLPVIISLATAAFLLLVAVASSFFASISFPLLASSALGIGTSLALLAVFAADYAPRPSVLRIVDPAESKREAAALLRQVARQGRPRECLPQFPDEITVNFSSGLRLERESSTLSLS